MVKFLPRSVVKVLELDGVGVEQLQLLLDGLEAVQVDRPIDDPLLRAVEGDDLLRVPHEVVEVEQLVKVDLLLLPGQVEVASFLDDGGQLGVDVNGCQAGAHRKTGHPVHRSE